MTSTTSPSFPRSLTALMSIGLPTWGGFDKKFHLGWFRSQRNAPKKSDENTQLILSNIFTSVSGFVEPDDLKIDNTEL